MEVVKRNGERCGVDFNKISTRIRNLMSEMSSAEIDPIVIAQKVCNGIYHGVTTQELDELSSEIAMSLSTLHPDYGTLSGYIAVSNLHKITSGNFQDNIHKLKTSNAISIELYNIVCKYGKEINEKINYQRDYDIDYFGLKTLEKAYLFKYDGKIIERPQDMWMRVSLGIHGSNLADVFETYDMMSLKYFTHATPTLFNSGTMRPQLSSCFLVGLKEDSISGIYDTLADCAQISKWAGGIGLHIHNLRATGADIRDIKHAGSGIVPMLRVFNTTARYVNQGGRRPGSIAIYLSVDHADILKFLELKKNHGDEEERCRDLFYACWIPDLFMERVKENKKWSLFCPSKAPLLNDLIGDEYKRQYEEYESLGLFNMQIEAQKLWFAICESQIETGTPYLLYKDACNEKSNQKNVGIIKSSNLCAEILEYSSPTETAVCNLASIALPKFIENGEFNFDKLHEISKIVTKNLNKVIDVNFYPTKESKTSNYRHRPIGVGVQGLADVYMKLRIPFESDEANRINKQIFETIYHGCLESSMELSKTCGKYETFDGSPLSKGLFQFDLWGETATTNYEWEKLRNDIRQHGVRNSLLVALMPTASTSQILGNNECVEPITSNIYVRRTLAGEFVMVNKYLVDDLLKIGKWNQNIKDDIIRNNGSVQLLDIPQNLKDIYKTVWEIKQKSIIDQAATRGVYVCQTQSMNLFVKKADISTLSSMHFYSWKKGLKTGIYYLRTMPVKSAIQFTIAPNTECTTCSS